jgi:hypothetical protein
MTSNPLSFVFEGATEQTPIKAVRCPGNRKRKLTEIEISGAQQTSNFQKHNSLELRRSFS